MGFWRLLAHAVLYDIQGLDGTSGSYAKDGRKRETSVPCASSCSLMLQSSAFGFGRYIPLQSDHSNVGYSRLDFLRTLGTRSRKLLIRGLSTFKSVCRFEAFPYSLLDVIVYSSLLAIVLLVFLLAQTKSQAM